MVLRSVGCFREFESRPYVPYSRTASITRKTSRLLGDPFAIFVHLHCKQRLKGDVRICAARISKVPERMDEQDGRGELNSEIFEGHDDDREQLSSTLNQLEASSHVEQARRAARQKQKHRTKASISRRKAVDWGLSREGSAQDKRRDLVRYLESLQQQPSTSPYVRHRIAMVNKALELLDQSRCVLINFL